MQTLLRVPVLKMFVTSQRTRMISSRRFRPSMNDLLLLWICNNGGKNYSISIITTLQPLALLHRYGSIVEYLPFFCAEGARRKFTDHPVIVRSHNDRRSVFPGYLKQKLHNFVGGFRIQVTGWFIRQYQF